MREITEALFALRDFIGKILGYFGASHELHIKRNVVTYGICVIIATVLWFLNALNKEYTRPAPLCRRPGQNAAGRTLPAGAAPHLLRGK